MINRSMSLNLHNVKEIVNRRTPFLLQPEGKDYLWGGSRLNEDFAKDIPLSPLAETWECSTHPDGISKVVTGEYRNFNLAQVLKEHPEILGTRYEKLGELPILVKLIDAKKDLSVQVHPDDEYARKNENGSLGKTEMWYVMDATKDASLVYGFYHDMDKEMLRKSLYDGDVERYLQKVSVKRDDVFFIPAGQVHAIGAGALIAEIQENSNITYRLYDYNRKDKDGNPRPLHIDKALDVMNLKGSSEPRQPLRVLKFYQGMATELLCRCQYFQVERLLLNTERCKQMAMLQSDETSFMVLLCVGGCGNIFSEQGEVLPIFRGDCVFVPAASERFFIHGNAKFLKITC